MPRARCARSPPSRWSRSAPARSLSRPGRSFRWSWPRACSMRPRAACSALRSSSISLGLVGAERMSERLGRNAAFASAGTGLAAAIMGAFGYYLSNRAVFSARGRAGLAGPLRPVPHQARGDRPGVDAARGAPTTPGSLAAASRGLPRNRPFVIFLVCIVLFHLANAAMLPLAASMMTLRSSEAATLMVAAAIVVPQFIVTLLSPWVGRWAQRMGSPAAPAARLRRAGVARLPVRPDRRSRPAARRSRFSTAFRPPCSACSCR